MKSGEDLIKVMEDKNLLSPDNLCFLQMLLHRIGNEALLEEVNKYGRDHEDDPISLYITKNKQRKYIVELDITLCIISMPVCLFVCLFL